MLGAEAEYALKLNLRDITCRRNVIFYHLTNVLNIIINQLSSKKRARVVII